MDKKMSNIIMVVIAVAIGLIMIGAVAYFYLSMEPEDDGYVGPEELDAVEIRNYKGQQLSSINAFRENSIKGVQYVDIEDYELKVTGHVSNEMTYTYDEILNDLDQYTKVVTLHCVEGWSATILWEGVLVRDIIDAAGATPQAKVVIFKAEDGYTTSLPIEFFYDYDIIMAHHMNNVTIPPERGYPFMLVAEHKWGYKWCKWITEIELSDDVDYEGYWEDRGYSNTADLDEPSWEGN